MRKALIAAIVILTVILVCVVVGASLFLLRVIPTSSASAPEATAQAPRVGALAPDFSLPGIDNKPVALADMRKNVVVVNFWATWCGPCRAELPALEKMRSLYASRHVVILGINQGESLDSVRGYGDLYHLGYPLLLDQKQTVGRAYRVQALPTTFFVDGTGTVRNIEIGGPMSESYLRDHIEAIMEAGQ